MGFVRFAMTVIGSAAFVAGALTLFVHGLIKHSKYNNQVSTDSQMPGRRAVI